MPEQKVMNRWLVVVGALLIQISLGAIYIYSVFKPALGKQFPSWTATDLALPSQLVLAFFALSTIFSGRIQDKLGPRNVAAVGGILLGAGLVIASFAQSLTMFVIGFSVIGGIGIGAAYVCPIATCVKCFPDKRGLITGLAVAGFGAGALVFTPVAKAFIKNPSIGIMKTFLYLGIIFCVAVVLGALFMKNPPPGWMPKGCSPPAPAAGPAGVAPAKTDYAWSEMLGKAQFWLSWLTYFAGCTAGLMVIMNTTNVWQSFSLLDAVKGTDTVPKTTYDLVVSRGQDAVMVVAIFNAIGRIAWGKISDNLGRSKTLFVMFLISGGMMLALNWLTSYALFLTGVAIVGFCFGGFLALFPAVTADFFGTKNVGVNYGLMFTAYGAGGLFGPWLAPKLMKIIQVVPVEGLADGVKAGNFLNAFLISGVLCVVSALIILAVKAPAQAPTAAAAK
jgi:OFA family oxalate/formate antiporter-like MFS transporter